MGTRGPAPEPAKLRILKGNGVDRSVDHSKVRPQPRAVPGAPDAPDSLGPLGLAKWNSVVGELVRMGILGRVDQTILELWCKTYEEWRAHPGGHGYSTVTMTLANLGSKLGLDPASRLRMTLPEAADDEEGNVFGTG